MEDTHSDESFDGTQRFEIRRRLGQGGMGVVYEAYDRVRCMEVALKTLRNINATSIYRLKREFRALTDVSHPNLVTLYELISDDDRWFFTMELVRGTNFISYVRQASVFAQTLTTGELLDPTLATHFEPSDDLDRHEEDDPTVALGRPPDRPTSIVNLRRLRLALRLLADGLCGLHTAGALHRDIKPSNVLVTDTGRVVILDFGLVAQLQPVAEKSATEQGRVIGTPAYMAPEQAGEDALGPAADWYAVGIMLYEALTGRLPFPGSGLQQLLRKYSDTPINPIAIAPGTPPDLAELCMALLARLPQDRPTGPDILEALRPGTRPPSMASIAVRSAPGRASSFVGRTPELNALERAFMRAKDGKPTTIYVSGPSGMGKTALVRRFLEQVETREDALVLSGRCYERESVPYKSVDAVIDALTAYLRSLSRLEVEALLPRDVRALAKVFPVLDRVDAIADAPTRRRGFQDKLELRQRAFGALKELLARISDRRGLIVSIDDLQWGDVDSAALLLDLMRPPEPPAMLLVGAFRSDDRDAPALEALIGPPESKTTRPLTIERPWVVELDPLSRDESVALATKLVPEASGPTPRVESIVNEASGNPFLVESLARHALHTGRESLTLDTVLRKRIAGLAAHGRQLLEVVAVAGMPLLERVAFRAAGLEAESENAALDALVATNLVQTHGAGESATIESYHDRIRVTVVEGLSPATIKDRHRSLALTLEMLAPEDAHALFVHFEGCGDHTSGAAYAAIAGDQAFDTLAFDRAAHCYRAALELGWNRSGDDVRGLKTKHAEALANAGRGTESAQAYLHAASDAPALEAIQLRRSAAEQYLISGRITEGVETLQSVLQLVGLELAPTAAQAYDSVMAQKAKLIARGLDFVECDAKKISPATLSRLDIMSAAARGLGMIDTVRGADFQLRHLLGALEIGEPVRIARALAMEITYVASAGGDNRQRIDALTQAALDISQRLRNPHALGICSLAIGVTAYMRGDWRKARGQLERTEKILRDQCTGVSWEIATTRIFLLGALSYLGEFNELERRTKKIIEDADARGDLYASTVARVGHANALWLRHDDPDEGRRQIQSVMSQWPDDEFYVQHWLAHRSLCDTMLYEGQGRQAYAAMIAVHPKFEASRLAETQYLWIDGLWLRVRACVAASVEVPAQREPLLAIAAEAAEGLCQQGLQWPRAMGYLGAGLIAVARGDTTLAIERLEAAMVEFDAAGMAMHGAVTRRRLGALVGGVRGTNLEEGADLWMTAQAVRSPSNLARMIAP